MTIDLTVSIINTNNRELLRACLKSVFENTHCITMEVYVVDNACTDGSAEMVTTEFPQVHLLRNSLRQGFCANHNKVLSTGTGRYFCILNEDTIIVPHTLDRLVQFLDDHDDVGAVGPQVLFPNGGFQASYSDFPTLWTSVLSACGMSRLILGPYYPSYPPQDSQQARAVDWVGGVCMVVRRETVAEVGLLDERFFVYSEETDWCYRMRKRGWSVWYLPEATILHYGERAWAQLSASEQIHRARTRLRLAHSQYLFLQKHYGQFEASLFLALFRISLGVRILGTLLSFLLNPGGRNASNQRLGLYLEGLRDLSKCYVVLPPAT